MSTISLGNHVFNGETYEVSLNVTRLGQLGIDVSQMTDQIKGSKIIEGIFQKAIDEWVKNYPSVLTESFSVDLDVDPTDTRAPIPQLIIGGKVHNLTGVASEQGILLFDRLRVQEIVMSTDQETSSSGVLKTVGKVVNVAGKAYALTQAASWMWPWLLPTLYQAGSTALSSVL